MPTEQSSTPCQRAYRAVFFDLDGTLLPMDIDEFLGAYYRRLGAFTVAHGYDAEAFSAALTAGTRAMMRHGACTNEEAFWETFLSRMDTDRGAIMAVLEEFYETDFGRIGDGVRPSEGMVRAVRTLHDKGYPLVLATMPLFPPRAVAWRLAWAGLDAGMFARLTTYDNSTSTKPKMAYYAENIAAADLRGADVLMVGNNTVEDLAAMNLGADAYLVTDYLLDGIGFDLATVKHGSAEQFAAWVETLPACADPARAIAAGPVDPALTQVVLERDLAPDMPADADLERSARAAYKDVASVSPDVLPGDDAR